MQLVTVLVIISAVVLFVALIRAAAGPRTHTRRHRGDSFATDDSFAVQSALLQSDLTNDTASHHSAIHTNDVGTSHGHSHSHSHCDTGISHSHCDVGSSGGSDFSSGSDFGGGGHHH